MSFREPWEDAEDYTYRQEREERERISRLPVCCVCEHHIEQYSAVRIDDEWYCDECIEDKREVIDDY